ncbi:MAG TPA: (Fe-S)-binding protein [Thermoplasmata archaeon]|nr:(Fe-S)-binding protein [Thermoplasmata archaeon]
MVEAVLAAPAVETPSPMDDALRVLVQEGCIQCNKCTFNCPVHRVDALFSPRKVILQAYLGGGDEVNERDLWACLTCGECQAVCPTQVPYPAFIRAKREKLRDSTERLAPCKHGGFKEILAEIMAKPGLRQDRRAWIGDGLKVAEKGDVIYFTGCMPYLDGVFSYCDSAQIGRSAIRLMNAAGIVPVVANAERCCGHDALWNGKQETFEKLARANAKWILETGAKRLVTTCAECYSMLKYEYPKAVGPWPLEVLHMSELLEELVQQGRLKFTKPLDLKVTYQDPCRLGRHSKEYDAPRAVLKALPGVQFTEMDRVRENAMCCGVGAYSNCDAATKFMQQERLEEAASKADHLVTACPHCRIHFSCYLDGKPVDPLPPLKIVDLTVLAAEALG